MEVVIVRVDERRIDTGARWEGHEPDWDGREKRRVEGVRDENGENRVGECHRRRGWIETEGKR